MNGGPRDAQHGTRAATQAAIPGPDQDLVNDERQTTAVIGSAGGRRRSLRAGGRRRHGPGAEVVVPDA